MRDKTFRLNIILTIVLGIVLLAGILVRVFAPIVMLPKLDIPNIVLISLVALLLDNYLRFGKDAEVCVRDKQDYIWIVVLAVLTFGLLPWVAGFVRGLDVLKMAVTGGVVFTAVTWMFSSVQERIQSGKSSKATLVICALGIYLAAQCFAGMIL